MMILSVLILASGDSVGLKLVPFVIILIFWGITAVASVAKKAREEAARRRQMQERLARLQVLPPPVGHAVRPPPVAPRAAPRRVAPPPIVQAPLPPLSQIARPAVARKKPVAVPPVAPGPAAPPVRVAAAPPRDGAPAVRRWLTPAALRSQIILIEVLKPAVGLKPPQNW